MPTFADLLTSYMARIGVGDAEFARRLGVSRLTLIRWKEGVTLRPRYREDVLRCAELLRLGPDERDGLLLSAGFSPVDAPQPEDAQAAPSSADVDEANETDEPQPIAQEAEPDSGVHRSRTRKKPLVLAVALVVLLAAVGAGGGAVTFMSGPGHPTAVDGESLILMAEFANYTAGQQGFNVRGRLKQEIDQEVRKSGLSTIRTAEWPMTIASESAASDAGQRAKAAIVIWGEYDSGRVMATFTIPEGRSDTHQQLVVDIDSSPSDLPTTINIDLPDEVRSLALLTLGQLYLDRSDFDHAKTVLVQALGRPPIDPDTLASLRYRLGLAYLGGELADLDEAIWLFTQVLAVKPRSADTYSSRGLAYSERGRKGDSALAVRDLSQAVAISPDSESSFVNRAAIYLERGWPRDSDLALDDLETALSINPRSTNALVNRAAAYLYQGGEGDLERAFDDLEQAIDIQPGLAAAYINLGNAYLDKGGESALKSAAKELTRAIELESDSPVAHFNRGLVNSALQDWDLSTSDFVRAQVLRPNDIKTNTTLCWHLGIQRESQRAMPYCDLAVSMDPGGLSLDSRGLVYAVMGRHGEAINDFEDFLLWVDLSVKESCRARYRDSRLAWIEELRAGKNPFDQETLVELRVKPISSRDDPC